EKVRQSRSEAIFIDQRSGIAGCRNCLLFTIEKPRRTENRRHRLGDALLVCTALCGPDAFGQARQPFDRFIVSRPAERASRKIAEELPCGGLPAGWVIGGMFGKISRVIGWTNPLAAICRSAKDDLVDPQFELGGLLYAGRERRQLELNLVLTCLQIDIDVLVNLLALGPGIFGLEQGIAIKGNGD